MLASWQCCAERGAAACSFEAARGAQQAKRALRVKLLRGWRLCPSAYSVRLAQTSSCLGSKATYTVSRQAAAAAGDGPGTQKALVDKGRRRQSFAPACASGSHSQHQACHASVRLVKTGERCCCCSRGASQREPVCLVEHERRRGGERDAALRHHRRRRRAHNTATARSHMMAQRILSHHKHSILQL